MTSLLHSCGEKREGEECRPLMHFTPSPLLPSPAHWSDKRVFYHDIPPEGNFRRLVRVWPSEPSCRAVVVVVVVVVVVMVVVSGI